MKINEFDVLVVFFLIVYSGLNALKGTTTGTDWGFYEGVFISLLMYVPTIVIQHKWYNYRKNGDYKHIKIIYWLAFWLTYSIASELSVRIVGGFNRFYYFSNFKYDYAVLQLLVLVIGAGWYYIYLVKNEKKLKAQ